MTMLNKQPSGKVSLWVILLLTVGGGLMACRDKAINDLSPADSPVYITNYDSTTHFGQYKTFSIIDSVIIQANDQYGIDTSLISKQFINDVAKTLVARGFRQVPSGQTADLGVAISYVDNLYTGVASNPYSYYGYSPYYPSYYTYQVSDQYWEIQVGDLKNSTPATSGQQQQVTIVYDATIRGSDIADTPSVDTAVNAIFNQSPYLKTP